jgi:hypothetical protein
MSKNDNLVSVSEMDYLEEDDPIRGQQYVCLSFLSPEEIIEKKEVFMFNKFISNFKNDVNELFTNLKDKYKEEDDVIQSIADKYRFLFNDKWIHEEYQYFLKEKEENLSKEFAEQVDFQTSVRGIKVRGSYETMREAQIRSEVLKRKDKKHNIFIASVGCWCPWDPNPDNIDDQHYSEDRLNTLMKKYKENQAAKDELFENRKREMIENQTKKNQEIKKQNDLEEVKNDVIWSSGLDEHQEIIENFNKTQDEEETKKVFEGSDPWIKNKEENENTENTEN